VTLGSWPVKNRVTTLLKMELQSVHGKAMEIWSFVKVEAYNVPKSVWQPSCNKTNLEA